MLELVRQSYDNKWYTTADVATFVIAGFLTKNDYKTVTGQDYDNEAQQPA